MVSNHTMIPPLHLVLGCVFLSLIALLRLQSLMMRSCALRHSCCIRSRFGAFDATLAHFASESLPITSYLVAASSSDVCPPEYRACAAA